MVFKEVLGAFKHVFLSFRSVLEFPWSLKSVPGIFQRDLGGAAKNVPGGSSCFRDFQGVAGVL